MPTNFKRALSLLPGWRTSRKLLVIQSDDWFAIRTSSATALEELRALGVEVDRCHYMRLDHFERAQDLSDLFDTLSSVVDQSGRPACLTANCLSANPDFNRIERSGFAEYHREPSLVTASRIPGAERNMELWKEAINAGICQPQSHGREHLNVPRWLKALQSGSDLITRAAFNNEMYAVSGHVVPHPRESFLASFDNSGDSKPPDSEPIVADAMREFETMFGFPSRSFIAPNYTWSPDVELALQLHGIEYIQSGRAQWVPLSDGSGRQMHRRFIGHTNGLGQSYLVRNVDFEPSSAPSKDWQSQALSEINLAFRLRKPAVISAHRVNFMGGLDPANRDRGLFDLYGLLKAVVKRWPTVEFVSTTELGDIIKESQFT